MLLGAFPQDNSLIAGKIKNNKAREIKGAVTLTLYNLSVEIASANPFKKQKLKPIASSGYKHHTLKKKHSKKTKKHITMILFCQLTKPFNQYLTNIPC